MSNSQALFYAEVPGLDFNIKSTPIGVAGAPRRIQASGQAPASAIHGNNMPLWNKMANKTALSNDGITTADIKTSPILDLTLQVARLEDTIKHMEKTQGLLKDEILAIVRECLMPILHTPQATGTVPVEDDDD